MILAVSDACGNLVLFLYTVLAWPSIYGSRLTPVGADRIGDTLDLFVGGSQRSRQSTPNLPNTFDQRPRPPQYQVVALLS